ncbi:hypothetical protein ACHAPE_008356 [Trichoderma viride]
MAFTSGIDFIHLMRSGQYSDVTLVCQGKEFQIHKLVVCSQSPVIAAALKGEFMEAQSGVINIEIFDAETVRRMVEYLYTKDYDELEENSQAAAPVAIATPSTVPSTAPSTTPSIAPSATLFTAPTLFPAARTTPFTVPPFPAFSSTLFAATNTTLFPASSSTRFTLPSTTLGAAPSRTPSTANSPVLPKGTLHHVQVNAIADYYGIQGLALLANQKIQQAYFTNWDANAFVASANAAINDSGDKSLHNMMALLTAQKLKELLKSSQLPGLVGDFAASVLTYHVHLLEASQREQGQVAQQQQQAQAATQQQLNGLEIRCQAAEARATRIIENVGKLVSLSNNQMCCRNISCEGDFGSYVESTGDFAEPTYILRCSWCHCKHVAN